MILYEYISFYKKKMDVMLIKSKRTSILYIIIKFFLYKFNNNKNHKRYKQYNLVENYNVLPNFSAIQCRLIYKIIMSKIIKNWL